MQERIPQSSASDADPDFRLRILFEKHQRLINYTAIVRGKDGGTGSGLVEAYDRGSNANSVMANISTRGLAEAGDNVLIGGFIAGGQDGATRVVVRAIGPSLEQRDVQGAMQDPTIELFDANGEELGGNDNWREAPNRAEIEGRGLALQDDREAALLPDVAAGPLHRHPARKARCS
ncbi:MAG: hypothetical protein H0W20_03075 [Chthoniobacterales bacterium]|nr:hypothetical protein [Chthoniobacterales bacterium]